MDLPTPPQPEAPPERTDQRDAANLGTALALLGVVTIAVSLLAFIGMLTSGVMFVGIIGIVGLFGGSVAFHYLVWGRLLMLQRQEELTPEEQRNWKWW